MRIPVVAALALAAGSCAPKFDGTREEAPGTFGERVVTLMCKRLAYEADRTDVTGSKFRDTCDDATQTQAPAEAPPTVAALATDRTRLAAAVDFAVPPDQTGALQSYLTSDAVLGMYDDDTMATTTKSLSDLLALMGSRQDTMDALARLGGHQGYRAPAVAIGPNQALLSAQHIDDVLDTVLPAIDTGGAANAQWNAVLAATGATFADASESAVPVDARLSTLLRDLMLTERANIAEPDATPLPMVRRDRRGVAMVALSGGVVPPPFVDADGDGLADVDAQGRFVDVAGMPLVIATPFAVAGDTAMRDPQGRAVDPQMAPIYQYFDVNNTLFGSISHDTKKLLDPANSTLIDFVRGASRLLGDRADASKTFDDGQTLAYRGYDTTASPLLDLAYAFTTLLRDANTANVLALTVQLFSPQHAATTARLAEDAIQTARLADAHTEAQIVPTAPLWDDLRPVLAHIASKPKLMADILAALQKPESKALADRFREFMTYNDRFDIDDNTQAVTGNLTAKPDRTMPDSGFNRSLFQRLAMVIADSNVGQCNKEGAAVYAPGLPRITPLATYTKCQLFQIENLAVFYLQAIVYNKDASGNVICESTKGVYGPTQTKPSGDQCASIGAGWRPQRKANFNYQWGGVVSTAINAQGGDAFIESGAGITGFWTHPTPEALNRVLFKPTTPQAIQDTSDPIVDRDGDLMKTKHAGTLPVWEKNNFYDEIRPLAQAFADAGEEQAFVDVLTILHEHWSSAASTTTQHANPSGKNYTSGGNAVSYEPLVQEVLMGDLWPALIESLPELTAITVNNKKFSDVITASMAFLTTPQAGLADRQGKTTSTTSDGKTVATLSPWQLLADAYVAKRARLAALGDEGKLWSDSGPELVDILFRGQQDAMGKWSFANPRTPAVTIAITQFLASRIAAHDAAGDRVQWLSTDLPSDMKDKLTHPVFAALVDLIDELAAEGSPLVAIENLLVEVMDDANAPAFATMRVGNADLLQLATDDQDLIPIGHTIGDILAPTQTFVATQLAFLRRLHAADGAHTLRDITARMFTQYDPVNDPGVPTISAIVDGVGDVDKVAPSATQPAWTGADYAAVFASVSGFLAENQYGLPRFIAIVKDRHIQ